MTRIPAGIGHRICSHAVAWVTALMLAVAMVCIPQAVAMDDGTATDAVTVDINTATAPVTAQSGYHLTLDIANPTDHALPAGTVTLSTNVHYTFISRTDIQQWAQDEVGIPTPQVLAEVQTPDIAPGGTATVAIDADADNAVLTSIAEWGPKPLRVDFHTDGTSVETHTFLTRSAEGLNGAATPALNVTVALPLSSTQWQVDTDDLTTLLTDGADADSDVISLSKTGEAQVKEQTQLLNNHPGVQVVADPTYLDAMRMPIRSSAIMQPAGFDITAYAAADTGRYDRTGIRAEDWNAATALAQYRQALGDDEAELDAVAWQGSASWTQQALTTAKRQGYDTVVATSDFSDMSLGIVRTDTTVVPTDAGDVTVLAAQPVLSGLAQGQATSQAATAERTAGGRLARFVAQSAFYQMEQPYTERNLLICLDSSTDTATLDALLSAIEQSPWLQMTDLHTLMSATPSATGQDALLAVPDGDGAGQAVSERFTPALDALGNANDVVIRFRDSVLTDAQEESMKASEDTQALARQDADSVTHRSEDTTTWVDQLLAVNRRCALHALSYNATADSATLAGPQTIAETLSDAVRITPIESLNVVSETANMPVTVSNALPYPVRVQVSATTDSMTIVTSRLVDVVVPPTSEEQTTLAIRVSTSGTANAQLTLLDREGNAFGAAQSTTITSALQISDMSGFIIIVCAVLLGIAGLWRQFHRVKDPDE